MDCAYNIITANFSGGKTHATTARVYQWSRGIELCITGADNLPQTFKAHFSVQKKGGVATTIVGIDERVDVPNVLFTIGKDIHVWLGASETEDDAEILYTVDIPVAPAPMPEYYDAEDTGVFDAVVEQVSGYAATATAAANSAGVSATAAAGSASAAAASASSAAGSAGAAEQARADAVTAKGQAETAAQTATEKALQTAQNASQAALDAGRAESAAERAESAESGAGAAKTAAEAAAQSAAASAATADEKATLAEQSATAAAGSASAAAQSAASIEGDVQIASQKASEAQTAAGQAVTAKDAAVTAQQGAETAATNAGQSASTATAKASEAATSASGAAQSKTDAEAAAARAEQAAATLTVDDELSSTSTNPVQNKVIDAEIVDVKGAIRACLIADTASGAIASFPDGAAMPMEGLTVEMSPIQDLHGQDVPYPAGGGKNKLPITLTSDTYYGLTVIVDDKDGIKLTGTTDSTGLLTLYSGDLPSGITPGESYIFSWGSAVSTMRLFAYNASNVRTVLANSGSATSVNVTIPSDAVRLSADINVSVSGTTYNVTVKPMIRPASVSDATYAPYSNICPITGRESVTVVRTGKNLLNYADYSVNNRVTSVTDNGDGSFTVVGSGNNAYIDHVIDVIPGETYSIKCESSTNDSGNATQMGVVIVYDGATESATPLLNVVSINSRKGFTPSGSKVLVRNKVTGGSGGGTGTIVKPQLELGGTATAYEAYQPVATVTIQLGTTIYGGTVDVTTGTLTVTDAMVDLGSLTWNKSGDSPQGGFIGVTSPSGNIAKAYGCDNIISTAYAQNTKKVSPPLMTNGMISGQTINNNIYVRDDRASTAADIKTLVSGVFAVYELLTPITIPLTAQQMTTLKGTNNVWSDADSVTVDYIADPKLYIARLTEPDADMVADANITSGKYFMVGNSLFLATSNIASGATIVPGVNCTKTNLSAALNAINS